MRRSATTALAAIGVLTAIGLGTACGPPSTPPPPGSPAVVVEGPVYALDTVVVRGAGCDPNIPTGVRLAVWPIGTQNYTELHAMGHSQSAVQPDGTVSATFLTSVLAAGSYYASLVCTGAIETNPATSMTVVAGLAPQASVTVTSARPGGTAVLTARQLRAIRPRRDPGLERGSRVHRRASASTARRGPMAPSSRPSWCRPTPPRGPTTSPWTAAAIRPRPPTATCR